MKTPNVARPTLPSIGELLSSSWQFYKAHWKKIFFTIAIWYIAVMVLLLLMAASFFALGQDLTSLFLYNQLPQFDFMYVPLALFGVLAMVVSLLGYVALFYVAGRPEYSVKEAYRKGTKKLLPFVGLTIVLGVVLFIGYLVAIVPGVIFSVWFGLSVFVLLAEDRGVFASFTQSKSYVKGYFWAVLGRYAGLALVVMLPVLILSALTGQMGRANESFYALNFLVDLLSTFVLTPLGIIYLWHLYRELKSHTEIVPAA